MTLTALARMSTPFKMLARPSLENLISLWAPRLSTGFAAFAAEWRTAEDDAEERRCMAKAGARAEPDKKQRRDERGEEEEEEGERETDSGPNFW